MTGRAMSAGIGPGTPCGKPQKARSRAAGRATPPRPAMALGEAIAGVRRILEAFGEGAQPILPDALEIELLSGQVFKVALPEGRSCGEGPDASGWQALLNRLLVHSTLMTGNLAASGQPVTLTPQEAELLAGFSTAKPAPPKND